MIAHFTCFFHSTPEQAMRFAIFDLSFAPVAKSAQPGTANDRPSPSSFTTGPFRDLFLFCVWFRRFFFSPPGELFVEHGACGLYYWVVRAFRFFPRSPCVPPIVLCTSLLLVVLPAGPRLHGCFLSPPSLPDVPRTNHPMPHSIKCGSSHSPPVLPGPVIFFLRGVRCLVHPLRLSPNIRIWGSLAHAGLLHVPVLTLFPFPCGFHDLPSLFRPVRPFLGSL